MDKWVCMLITLRWDTKKKITMEIQQLRNYHGGFCLAIHVLGPKIPVTLLSEMTNEELLKVKYRTERKDLLREIETLLENRKNMDVDT